MHFDFFIQLVIILISARLFGELATHFKFPSVVGELIAGILIGPSLFNLVTFSPFLEILSEIGVILLLFEVGLETDLKKLYEGGLKALIVATLGVAFPFFLGFITAYYLFNFSFIISLFIGSALTPTSIGITLRILRDLKKQHTKEAQIILGAAVLDDVLAIIILGVLGELAISNSFSLFSSSKVILFIGFFFLVSPFFIKLIGHLIRKWDEKTQIPGLVPTMSISLVFLFSWIAGCLNTPQALGGFAAGLALATPFTGKLSSLLTHSVTFTEKIKKEMSPITHLFTPIFFISIGASIDLHQINWSSSFIWIFSSLLLIVAILGKCFSSFFLTKETLFSKAIIGSAMIPRGEIGLIFSQYGFQTGVLTQSLYASILLVIILSTLIAPFLLKGLYNKHRIGR